MEDKRLGPNPRVSDVKDVRYTSLHELSNRIDLTMMLSDDAYFQNGFILYDLVKRFDEVMLGEGDFVSVQNRYGFVTKVLRDKTNKLIGLELLEYLPYDVKRAKEIGSAAYFGKGSTDDKRKVVYLFRAPSGLEKEINGVTLFNGGGLPKYEIFRGSMKVLHKVTSNKNTWNDIQKASDKYNSKFD